MSLPPLVEPVDRLSDAERERTARHAALAGFGDVGQRRLAAAHVVVVGAGGLGSSVVPALAAAGIGRLTVVDDDVVDATNLHRQVMHRLVDVGRAKVDSAVRVAADLSPETRVDAVAERLTGANADAVLQGADVVVDGTDAFASRAVVAAACDRLGVPLVWGVVQEQHAQVTVLWSAPPAGAPRVTLDDLHPPATVGEVPSCAQVGVLGALCMQVGGLMAMQVVQLVAGVGEPLLGRVAVIDGVRGRQHEVPIRPSQATAVLPVAAPTRVDAAEASRAVAAGATLLDVREPAEIAQRPLADARLLTLGALLADPAAAGHGPFVVACRTGARAAQAASALLAVGVEASVLAGGIEALGEEAALPSPDAMLEA